MLTTDDYDILTTALRGMVMPNTPIEQQVKFYIEKVLPLIQKLDALKKESIGERKLDATEPK